MAGILGWIVGMRVRIDTVRAGGRAVGERQPEAPQAWHAVSILTSMLTRQSLSSVSYGDQAIRIVTQCAGMEHNTMDLRLDAIAQMLEALDRKGDAECKLSPDARRLLTQATILIRHEADTRA